MSGNDPQYPNHDATLPTQSEFADGVRTRVPVLTILYHPDYRRIGERAVLRELLDGRAVALSRVEPHFTAPERAVDVPIADPYVSASKPVHLSMSWLHGVEVIPTPGARVSVGRQALTARRAWSVSELIRGVILALNRRVLLLLHVSAVETQPESLPAMGLVGSSDAIRAVRGAIRNVADLDVPVLIQGETGVGKEHVARAIHSESQRANAPFVAINTAALNHATAVSELFGHVRGAFTGASTQRAGLFEQADGGTLFLDEIGEVPDTVQTMLLRVLQTGAFRRMGDSTLRTVDVRIVAATDANLEQAMSEGRFRSALFHRLSAYRILVPPLRERVDDLARLMLHFLRLELQRLGQVERLAPRDSRQKPWFSASTALTLFQYRWPGNVRELVNVVRQLLISNRDTAHLRLTPGVLMADGESRDTAADTADPEPVTPWPPAPPLASRPASRPASHPNPGAPARRAHSSPPITVAALIEALRAHDFAVKPTARTLGVAPSTLYDMIEQSERLRTAKAIPRDELQQCLADCDGDIRAMSQRLMVSTRALRMRLRELDLLPGKG